MDTGHFLAALKDGEQKMLCMMGHVTENEANVRQLPTTQGARCRQATSEKISKSDKVVCLKGAQQGEGNV